MTVVVTIKESHWFRWYLLLKGLKRTGLKQASCPSEGIIVGEASEEVLTKISQIPGIASVEPVEQRSALSYPK